jgi:hypothetical protein
MRQQMQYDLVQVMKKADQIQVLRLIAAEPTAAHPESCAN